MSITLKLHTMLQSYTDNHETVEVDGQTIGECLQCLVDKYPEMEKELFRTRGNLFGFFDIHVNGESSYPSEMEKKVFSGDEIEIAVFLPRA